MTRAAVLIGVAKTGGLPRLNDAIGGAQRMKQWALQQGFAGEDVYLITDETAPVKIAHIQETIHALVDAGTLEQLIVYFAGHGANIGYSEYWLLSDAPVDSNAAINLDASAARARKAGIPHVVFISDACRTPAATIQAQGVQGSAVFPNAPVPGPERDVDIFFAATLGQPALELSAAPLAGGEYRAIYTDAFLDGVSGRLPKAMTSEAGNVVVVRPRRLKECLFAEIPRRFRELGFAATTPPSPDARITSGDDAWLARFPDLQLPSRGDLLTRGGVPGLALPDALNTKVSESLRDIQDPVLTRRPVTRGPLKRGDPASPDLPGEVPSWRKTPGAVIFIDGSRVEKCLPQAARVNASGTRIDIDMAGDMLDVLLVLADGSSIVVPAIRGHLMSVRVTASGFDDLMYLPRSAMEEPGMHRHTAALEQAHDLVAQAALDGVLHLETGTVDRIVAQTRDQDLADPALALYAAYALYRQHLRAPLEELHDLLFAQYGFAFFDIALLAEADDLAQLRPPFPLMSQGWALLQVRDNDVPAFLAGLRRHLKPSLWSHFDEQGTALLTSYFSQGD